MATFSSLDARTVPYRTSTVFAAFAMGATGIADLLRAPAIMESLAHLGYPIYFVNILGTWEILGALAILLPTPPRLKDWAYAGMFFTLTGAALSHLAVADPALKVLTPLVVLAAVVVSAATRPAHAVAERVLLPPRRPVLKVL